MGDFKYTAINRGLKLKEYSDGLLFGTDALLLSGFASEGAPYPLSKRRGIDLGTGSGVIPLLILADNKALHITGIDIQERYAVLAEENARDNGLDGKFTAIHGDIREIKKFVENESFDFVTSNPPYLKAGGGKHNISDSKRIARHEEYCGANELCAAAFFCLKFGGVFYLVYLAERICTAIEALRRNRLEPKRIRFVGSKPEKPSLVLIEAKKGAAEGAAVSFELIP